MRPKHKVDPDRLARRIAGVLRALKSGDYTPAEALRAVDTIIADETQHRPLLSGWSTDAA